MENSKPVGIDLGTTRSAIAHVQVTDVEVLFNDEGDALTPSVVTIEDNNVTVGRTALNQAVLMPEQTITEVKRKMGEDVKVTIEGQEYRPEQISSLILSKLVDDAEQKMGAEVESAVITVPAYFGENQRTATEKAGEIAGIEVSRLLPEPSAACLAYGLEQGKLEEEISEIVFVYDLGGGTFDASLVDVDYEFGHVETLHTDGLNNVGGSDWTSKICGWITEKVIAEGGADPADSPQIRAQIKDKARDIKHTLSSKDKALLAGMFGGVALSEELTREEFDTMTEDLLEQTIEATDDLFERSDYGIDDVDKVLLVGGSTRMPQVRERVEEYFGMEPSLELNPDRAVAQGAAIQAELLGDTPTALTDSITGVADGLVLVDVAPRSLGVRLHDGTTSHIIESDDEIPTKVRRENYRTIDSKQTAVKFPILEGEAEQASENEQIGQVRLENIPPRSTKEDSLAVEFELTSDGTLKVEAEDLITGKAVDAEFESVVSHSPEEITTMQEELPSTS